MSEIKKINGINDRIDEKYRYESVNFEKFGEEGEAGLMLTELERKRILNRFYQTAKAEKNIKRSKKRKGLIAAAAVCLALCLGFTPAGENVWAAARNAFMGIGQFLGMSAQDNYVTVVDQTKTQNGITFTLNEVVASDYQMRYSVTVETDDGRILGLSEVEENDTYINGLRIGYDIPATGRGPYGSKKDGKRGIYFSSLSYYDFEMPLNPQVNVVFYAENEKFEFDFTLKNEGFKAATKEITVNREFDTPDGPLKLEKLIITPLERIFTTENDGTYTWNKEMWYSLEGTDNLGDEVVFEENPFAHTFDGRRKNEDKMTYQLKTDVTSYTMQLRGWKVGEQRYYEIGEPFTVEIQ